MPLCPQITNTPVTVTQTADFTVSSVLPVVPATTTQLDQVIVLADGKTKAYYQTTAPTTGLNRGDIWFDTDDGNKQYYYTGTAWVSVQDNAIATAQATADSKIKTFYQTSAPTATDIGDIWFDSDDGFKQYFWNGTAWTSVQDTSIAAAQSAATAAAAAAGAAQTTADGKNKVFRQTSAPTATAAGDLWFDTDDDNRIYRWNGSSWVANDLGNNALASISANKITAGTIDASVITVSNLNAGNISTGTLNADRIASASITGTKIAAGTITASNITSGTITASQIAASTITGSLIAAATITASNIAATTITASQIATATITATQIAAGTITAANLATGTLSANNITTGTLSASVGLSAVTGTIGGFTISATSIFSSTNLVIESTGNISGGNSQTLFYGFVNIGGGFASGERLIVTGNSSFVGNLITTGNITAQNDFYYPFPQTVSGTANLRVIPGSTPAGRIVNNGASSQRYKHDIVNLRDVPELDPYKLYELPVRAFRYNLDYLSATDDRYDVLIPGFIAEEVDEFYPLAADYEEAIGIYTWNERMIIPAMVALIQDLHKEIQLLKGE